MSGEKRELREKKDNMTAHLVRHGTPREKAEKIAREQAIKAERRANK